MTPDERAEKVMRELKEAGERFPCEAAAFHRIAIAIAEAEQEAAARAVAAEREACAQIALEVDPFAYRIQDCIAAKIRARSQPKPAPACTLCGGRGVIDRPVICGPDASEEEMRRLADESGGPIPCPSCMRQRARGRD